MKCANCGKEMPEGALYCEYCGEDIHIVPDFEPELEENIQQIIEGIREEIDEKKPADDLDEEASADDLMTSENSKGSMPKRWIFQLSALAAALVLTAATGMGMWVYRHNSQEYQVSKAVQYAELGEYDRAIAYYNRALELDEGNIELRFDLAEIYLLKNNKIEYEYLLREIIKDENASSEQLDGAYGRLIAIYRDRQDYLTINELLLGSNNDELISMYANYISNPPEFSVIEGYYTSIQALKLTAVGNGRIYYTLDGGDPDEDSLQYTMPILLENGDYLVKAVFINEYGIVSTVASKEYHIDNDVIPPPEINLSSGTYNIPMDIQVLGMEEEDEIYYTTDGSTPGYASNLYTQAIHMPLGKSTYKFARIVDGVTGDVTERYYELALATDFTVDQAYDAIVEYARSSGRILDEAGHFGDTDAIYIYEYLYVTNVNEVSDFYVFAEVQRESDGSQVRTGNFYAVDIYLKTRYRLQQSGSGRYSLEAIDLVDEEVSQ